MYDEIYYVVHGYNPDYDSFSFVGFFKNINELEKELKNFEFDEDCFHYLAVDIVEGPGLFTRPLMRFYYEQNIKGEYFDYIRTEYSSTKNLDKFLSAVSAFCEKLNDPIIDYCLSPHQLREWGKENNKPADEKKYPELFFDVKFPKLLRDFPKMEKVLKEVCPKEYNDIFYNDKEQDDLELE